nr:MAG TPA: hypothetical protein [Caudoviricetes sp.]
MCHGYKEFLESCKRFMQNLTMIADLSCGGI